MICFETEILNVTCDFLALKVYPDRGPMALCLASTGAKFRIQMTMELTRFCRMCRSTKAWCM
jgi:hypothetical protein